MYLFHEIIISHFCFFKSILIDYYRYFDRLIDYLIKFHSLCKYICVGVCDNLFERSTSKLGREFMNSKLLILLLERLSSSRFLRFSNSFGCMVSI